MPLFDQDSPWFNFGRDAAAGQPTGLLGGLKAIGQAAVGALNALPPPDLGIGASGGIGTLTAPPPMEPGPDFARTLAPAPAVASPVVGPQPPEYGPEMPMLNTPAPSGPSIWGRISNAASSLTPDFLENRMAQQNPAQVVQSIPALQPIQTATGDALGAVGGLYDDWRALAPQGPLAMPDRSIVGNSTENVGRAIGEGLVPTTPLELGLTPLLGLTPFDDALMGGGRAVLGAGRSYLDDAARVGLDAVPEGAIREIAAPPAILRGLPGNEPAVSPTLGEGYPAVNRYVPSAADMSAGGGRKLTPEELIAQQKALLGDDAATWAPAELTGQARRDAYDRGAFDISTPKPEGPQTIDELRAKLRTDLGPRRVVGQPLTDAPSGVGAGQAGTAASLPSANAVPPATPERPPVYPGAVESKGGPAWVPAQQNLGEGYLPGPNGQLTLRPQEPGTMVSDGAPPLQGPPEQMFGPAPTPKPPEPGTWVDELQSLIAAPMTMKSILSPPLLRQGLVRLVSNPVQAAKEFGISLKSAFSESTARKVMEGVESSPWVSPERVTVDGLQGLRRSPYEGYTAKEVGLNLRDWGPNVPREARDPTFQGLGQPRTLVETGLQKVSGPSERQTAVQLNLNASRWYEDEAAKMWAKGNRNADDYRALAAQINHFMQWGDVGQGKIPFFFSLRAISGRAQTYLDILNAAAHPTRALQPGAEREALKGLVSLVTANMALVGAASQVPGVEIEYNPLPTIHVDRLYHFDPWAGWNQQARLITGLIKRGSDTATGKATVDESLRGAVGSDIARFGRSGLGPIPGKVTDTATGKDFLGKPYSPTEDLTSGGMFIDLFSPFNAEGLGEAYKQGGLKGVAITGGPSSLSMGVNTYPDYGGMLDDFVKKMPAGERTGLAGKPAGSWAELPDAQRNAALQKYPELAGIVGQRNEASTSPLSEISQMRTTAMRDAFADFQNTGDGLSYRTALSDAANEARIRFDQETKGKSFEARTPEQKLLNRYFTEVADAAGKDYELRDRLDSQFRASLSPNAVAALDAALQTSSDPNYAQLKAARSYLESTYWAISDNAYRELAATAAPDSPVHKYATYNDLSKAASDRTNPDFAQVGKLKSAVDSRIGDQKLRARYEDPKADALLYIYGYNDTVISPQAQALVVAWAADNGVKLASPPMRSTR